MNKRFDVIELRKDISDAFKDRVFKAFKEYYCLSDLKWERKVINCREMLVLTSSSMASADSFASSSINAMRDGLRWGYAEGLAAPKVKQTKLQKLEDIYADVYGDHDRFLVRAERAAGVFGPAAESYYTKIKNALAAITPIT